MAEQLEDARRVARVQVLDGVGEGRVRAEIDLVVEADDEAGFEGAEGAGQRRGVEVLVEEVGSACERGEEDQAAGPFARAEGWFRGRSRFRFREGRRVDWASGLELRGVNIPSGRVRWERCSRGGGERALYDDDPHTSRARGEQRRGHHRRRIVSTRCSAKESQAIHHGCAELVARKGRPWRTGVTFCPVMTSVVCLVCAVGRCGPP